MEKLDIGVVVPTLNSAATLDWTLLSLHKQQGCDVQIIVADSGSTDGTLEICKRWGVPTIYVPPGNLYRAVNAGLRGLSTKWVTYLNSDDTVYGDAYARLIRLGNEEKADVVYGHYDYVDYFGRLLYSFFSISPNLLDALFRRGVMGFAQASAIFRKDLFQALNGFDETYPLVADFHFFCRAKKADHVFARLERPSVAAFRVHSGQLTQKCAAAIREEEEVAFAALGISAGHANLAVLRWRMSNIANYCVRLLRSSAKSMPGGGT
jgi:glycosyltransferase involved in cell wall biosynthesis